MDRRRIILGLILIWIHHIDCELLDDVCFKDDIECKRPNIKTIGNLQHGKCLKENILRQLRGKSLLECVKECLVTSQCIGINYRKAWPLCDVVGRSTEALSKETGCLYSDITTWSKDLAGHCKDKTCNAGKHCKLDDTGQPICILSYCAWKPMISNATSTDKFGMHRDIGKGNKYKCDDGYNMRGRPFLVCEIDGTWTSLFCCIPKEGIVDCGNLPIGSPSGVYTTVYKFDVYCEMNSTGSGWTVIQRRTNGVTDFKLEWNDYKLGFGSLTAEHWLGNHYLFNININKSTRNFRTETVKSTKMTSLRNYKLRVELEAFDGKLKYAEYGKFSVGDKGSNFKLTIDDYTGNLGDAMYYNNNMMFSTSDKDNDQRDTTCVSGGAWQGGCCFNGEGPQCSLCNLNGKYLNEDQIKVKTGLYKGIVWKTLEGKWYSFKSSKMTIYPIDALSGDMSYNENNNNNY
ncbi:unnamed protein product [Mytilus edulis]|uniref:Fibrinogen C-terminal domain-containing protein n=1 Tax=Mytilus edulis TaxID=6550 RepID=A0A8S3SY14_MYTED|nr:unnamed protein product [Mytilus edulis]